MSKIRFIVSSNIKKFRKTHKLTQEELAENTGIDYKYIQKIEGKNPPNIRVDTLEKIAAALKTAPAKLIQ